METVVLQGADMNGGGGAVCVSSRAMQRRSFGWRDLSHPFIARRMPTSDGSSVFQSAAAGQLHSLVANHIVQGRVVFPGAAHVELARAAAGHASLHGVFFVL